MTQPERDDAGGETVVTVRYWAAARAAAGVKQEEIAVQGSLSLAEIRARALALHPDSERMPAVLAVCSVLVDGTPLGTRDPASVTVGPGATVEFLPPFAGG